MSVRGHGSGPALSWWSVALLVLAFWFPLPTFSAEDHGELPVVVDGEPRAVIVVDQGDGRNVRDLAAAELQEHIEKITGVEVPVITQGEWEQRDPRITALVIGAGEITESLGVDLGELPPEGYRILTLPEKQVVILAGRDEGDPLGTSAPHNRHLEFGSLNAVYDLLEGWGVRWLFPGELGIIVPERGSLAVTATDRVESPDFRMRNLWLSDYRGGAERSLLGENDPDAVAARMWSLRNRHGNSTEKYHTRHHTPDWWSLWSESNLEFIGLYRGERGWSSRPERSKLCVSNPGVAPAIAELAMEAFREQPNRISYSIAEQDGSAGFCSCQDCTALDERLPGEIYYADSPSIWQDWDETVPLGDRYAVLWNRISEIVEEEFPDRYLGVYLHGFRIFPPRREESVSHRIRAVYVNNRQVDPEPLRERLEGWSRVMANPIALYIPPMFGAWPLADFERITLPVMTLENVRDGVILCRDLEIVGVRGSPNFASFTVGSHGVLAYALSRWLWDADLSTEEILQDFTQHAFGPEAGPVMMEYFQTMEARQNAYPAEILGSRRHDWMGHHLQVFTPDFVNELQTLLDQAEQQATSQEQQERIDLFRENLEFTAAQLEVERLVRQLEERETRTRRNQLQAAYTRCEELYAKLRPENRPPNPLFKRGKAGDFLE